MLFNVLKIYMNVSHYICMYSVTSFIQHCDTCAGFCISHTWRYTHYSIDE